MTNTTLSLPLLDRVTIASPCTARWEDMTGTDTQRHCAQCDLHVHNISMMTRDRAEAVLAKATEGRVCARLYRRPDGTILTADCPVGLAAIRAKARRMVARVAAATGLLAFGAWAMGTLVGPRLRALEPFATICRVVSPGKAPLAPTAMFPLNTSANYGVLMGSVGNVVRDPMPGPLPGLSAQNPTWMEYLTTIDRMGPKR